MAKVRFMSASFVSYLLNILLLCSCYAFRLSPNTISATRSGYRDLLSLHMNRNELGGNIVTKSLFALTEAFGSIGRLLISTDKDAAAIDVIPEDKMIVTTAQFDEIAQNILDEYKAIFWATGNMDTSLWTDNCTFADPFSSFGGKGSTARFKANADNLGKFVVDPSIRITSFEANQAEYTVIVGEHLTVIPLILLIQ